MIPEKPRWPFARTQRDARTHCISIHVWPERSGSWIKRRLTIVHSVSRHHRVSSVAAEVRRLRCGAGQFASVERETGVESGWTTAVAPDRYNKWDNDITGTPGSRMRPGSNVVIITFGSFARSMFSIVHHILSCLFPATICERCAFF